MMPLPAAQSLVRRIRAEESKQVLRRRIGALRDSEPFRKLVAELETSLRAHRDALLGPNATEELTAYRQGFHRGAISVGDVFIGVMDDTSIAAGDSRLLQLRKELDILLAETGMTPEDIEALE